MSIYQTLEKLRNQGRSALIPYLTAGVPDLQTTEKLLVALSEAGANLIELGVPFSDPVADGPVIQKASEHALAQGTSLIKILELVMQMRGKGFTTPLILFSYYNPIYHMGLENFAQKAKSAGVDAVLVVDLIPEAAAHYIEVMERVGLETVFLAAPTTDPARLQTIDQASTGCVYYVSRTGVTGARNEMSQDLQADLKALKSRLQKPLIVGFGISKPEHVLQLKGHADGIVVGSALMAAIEANPAPEQAIKAAAELIHELARELIEN